MTEVDVVPIERVVSWLDAEVGSITPLGQRMQERTVDTNELKRMIAAGEYRLDARAIAEAMLGRADREAAGELRPSQVLEARQLGFGSGRIK